MPAHLCVGDQQHQAEAARVVESDLPAIVHAEDDVIVPVQRMGEGAFRVVQGHASGHAEMGDQRLAVVEPQQQVLRASVDGADDPPLDPARKTRGQGHPQILAALLQAYDAAAHQPRHQPAPDGLYFRKFRHRP